MAGRVGGERLRHFPLTQAAERKRLAQLELDAAAAAGVACAEIATQCDFGPVRRCRPTRPSRPSKCKCIATLDRKIG